MHPSSIQSGQFASCFYVAGAPIAIRYRTGLRDTAGNEAHAATYIRERRIVLDSELKRSQREHHRILLHELFHFVWVRLGNPRRTEWEQILRGEWRLKLTGEAGWSAEWRKCRLLRHDITLRSRRWREYCCESFCDTGASVVAATRRERTLARGPFEARRKWFRDLLVRELPI